MDKSNTSTSQNDKLSEEQALKIRELIIKSNFEISDAQIAQIVDVNKSDVFKQRKVIIQQQQQITTLQETERLHNEIPESQNQFYNIFINKQNLVKYLSNVMLYLDLDYNNQNKPNNHFQNNKDTICEAFNCNTAMVVVNNKDELVGYMIWRICGQRLEIDIAEVKEEYRGRGIFKNMIQAILDNYVDVAVLIGSILPQSQLVFERMGWVKIDQDSNNFIKTIKPISQQLSELPDGLCVAVFSKFDLLDQKKYLDYYIIKDNVNKYKLKYFKIDLDESGRLNIPIVTKFEYEGYIGIFFNKQLIKDGKAKQLFKNATYKNLLILDKQNFVMKEEWNIK
ncbi:Conserved_hypothetical protein [Hexamita inflata]|uniref:N-acetyltransferase domain-containing protein n=1 Tax=Hexamita inflata TaxID=28002 RepID=A0AA86TA26_9EUKA|nr:Conserved hypothetical protein [Hexamita inflata]